MLWLITAITIDCTFCAPTNSFNDNPALIRYLQLHSDYEPSTPDTYDDTQEHLDEPQDEELSDDENYPI